MTPTPRPKELAEMLIWCSEDTSVPGHVRAICKDSAYELLREQSEVTDELWDGSIPDCPQCGGNEPEIIVIDDNTFVPICGLCGFGSESDPS